MAPPCPRTPGPRGSERAGDLETAEVKGTHSYGRAKVRGDVTDGVPVFFPFVPPSSPVCGNLSLSLRLFFIRPGLFVLEPLPPHPLLFSPPSHPLYT